MTRLDNTYGLRMQWPILLLLLALLTVGKSNAAWFMKMDGVDGELTEGPFAGWTQVKAVGSFVSRSPTNDTNITAISCEVRKAVDRTSPAILQGCGSGEAGRKVSLAYVLAQPVATQYRITLETALVSSVTHELSGDSSEPGPEEKVVLNFQKIEWACFELDTKGRTTGGLTALFDHTSGESALKSRPPFRAVIARENGRAGVQVEWPAESGRRYRIRGRETAGAPWQSLIEFTASEHGTARQFIATERPALFMSVEEVD